MQRQMRLKQFWSSSIDTPEIYKDKKFRPSVLFWAYTQVQSDFRGFCLNFISLSRTPRDL
jgi:hypothetical protein